MPKIAWVLARDHHRPGAEAARGVRLRNIYLAELWDTLGQLPDTSVTTLAVGAGSLAVLLLLRYRLPRWPRALIVMVLAILAVEAFDLFRPRGRDHRSRPDRTVLHRPP